MKIMTKIITIFLLATTFFSCKKECHTLAEFTKPVYPNAKTVTYGQLDCDIFLITVDGKKIFMTFNHDIISEQ